jgi:hypothetical protein
MRIVDPAAMAPAVTVLFRVAEDRCAARRTFARAAGAVGAANGSRHRMRALCSDMPRIDAIEAPAGVVRAAKAGAAPWFDSAATATATRIAAPGITVATVFAVAVIAAMIVALPVEMIVAPAALVTEAAAEAFRAAMLVAAIAAHPLLALPAALVHLAPSLSVIVSEPRADFVARPVDEAAIVVAAAAVTVAFATPAAIARALAVHPAAL